MSFIRLLSHRADIQSLSGTRDSWGDKAPDNWTTSIVNVRCRWYEPSGREMQKENTRNVVSDMHSIFLPPGTVVTEGDRVTEVRDFGGSVLTRDLNIIHVYHVSGRNGKEHHVELKCERQRGSNNAK